jgi:hypothetical protein
MQVGKLLEDPRSTGFGLWLLGYVALTSASYAEALEYYEQALALALTPWDRVASIGGKASALILLQRVEEALPLIDEHRRLCLDGGFFYSLDLMETMLGLCRVMQGSIGSGIRLMKETIRNRQREGYQDAADWCRLNLAEVYLQIIAGNEMPPFSVLLKNLPTLFIVTVTAGWNIRALIQRFFQNPHVDPRGNLVGRAEMILGLLCKSKRQASLASQHLTQARRILSQFGQTPILARVETALAELGQ